jgi:flagellar hook-associated protein 3 FlgL
MINSTLPSTASINQSTLNTLKQMQLQLIRSQQEVSTGRVADASQTLGYRLGDTVSLRQDQTRLNSIIDSNGLVKSRLDSSQAVLKDIASNAQGFFNSLLGAANSSVGADAIIGLAKTGSSAFAESINTTFNGTHLFSGVNTDVKPMQDYNGSPTPASRQSIVDAFTAEFGFAPSDPAASSINASSMQAFLDTTFAAQFADPAWGANWSGASSQNVRSRIGTSELIETSTNANDPAFRKLASAYAMVAELGSAGLNEQAFKTVINTARGLVGDSIGQLTQLQGTLGDAQARVKNANDRMTLQVNIMTVHLNGLELVDPTEASTKLTDLMTQIETAYTLTARIHKLSLLDSI